jgi:hypothetical protein
MVKKYFILTLALLALLVLPASVSAGTLGVYTLASRDVVDTGPFTYNSVPDGYVIIKTHISLNPSQNTDFVVTFNDMSTKSGYIHNGPTWDQIEINLDGVTDTSNMPIPFPNLLQNNFILELQSYTVNDTTSYNLSLYQTDFAFLNLLGPEIQIPLGSSLTDNPWVSLTMVPDDQIAKVHIGLITGDQLIGLEGSAGGQNEISWFYSIFRSIWDTTMLIWSIFSFFFIDNLLLMLLIIEGTILAYRFNTSKNVFLALSRTAADNQKLLTSLVGFIQMIISMTFNALQMLNPFKWIKGG